MPILIAFYVLGWHCLKVYKPKTYKYWKDIGQGFLWHFFKPREASGIELACGMKDLVRSTIYSTVDNVISSYKFFKESPDIEIIAIKEKMKLLGNITINFVYKDQFIGEM